MGVFPYDFEITSPVTPVRLFNALAVEADKVFPKAAPQAIKSVEVDGDGGPGTIVKINFAEGLPYQYVKHQVDAVDKANLSYSYSVTEGGSLGIKLEKISYENKFAAAAGGGTLCKSLMKFYTIGDYVYTEEDIKAFIQRTEVLYKGVEAYLLANPNICN
ncbi:MLP-like protein 423 [Hibiscus trionum]|uniref:MLP-like protein 423 n=1 Tax=Hibiscus trionum TaxID=183268 RepID=A0A9W7LWB7_HIBTR|nr:MLP-like protein 423 [Hibiscus trionum]